jgi:stage III sporulation protein AD
LLHGILTDQRRLGVLLDIVKVIGVELITTFAVMVLRPTKPELAAVVSIAGGLIVLLMFVGALETVINSFANIVSKSGIKSEVFNALLKIIGIGYLTEFAAGICTEAGNTSMAQRVNLAGKVIILVLALPIIENLIEIIVGILP